MSVKEFLQQTQLERVLLIGFYGGGNYGDELLLEVFENLFAVQGVKQVSIAYQNVRRYNTLHHDFGYSLIDMGDKKQLLRAIRRNKNIVVGGGGLWGLDVNTNILLLSALLFFSRWIMWRRVYLIGVGYYSSTTRLGRVSAWFAGKAANHIIARDTETLHNFQRLTKHVSLGKDVAWQLPELKLDNYRQDLSKIEGSVKVHSKTLFITLRRFTASQKNNYTQVIEQFIAASDREIIVALMEPRQVDPVGYKLITSLAKRYKHVQAIDFFYNPLALFLFFRKNQKQLALIGPQFHAIITAHLAGVPFFPMAYDNKVVDLLKQLGDKRTVALQSIQQSDIESFASEFNERQ